MHIFLGEVTHLNFQKHYFQRAPKEYQLAFDVVFNIISYDHNPTLAIIKNPRWAVELIRRTALPISFYDTGMFDLNAFITQAGDWAAGSMHIYPPSGQKKFETLIWVAPEKDQLKSLIQAFQTLSQPGAQLVVISPGRLNHFLPADQRLTHKTSRLATFADVSRSLRESDWTLQTRCGLHSIRVILHSLAARCAAHFGRPDWHDRLIFTSRAFYQEQGPLAPLATVMITIFRKV